MTNTDEIDDTRAAQVRQNRRGVMNKIIGAGESPSGHPEFDPEVSAVTLDELFDEIVSWHQGVRPMHAIHLPGNPGGLVITGSSASRLAVQVVLPRTDGEDAYYEVGTAVDEFRFERNVEDLQTVRETDELHLFYDVDTTCFTPVRLPETDVPENSRRGRDPEIALEDGLDYLRRKMHHQLNGGEVKPKYKKDIVPEFRQDELDLTGMPDE